MLQEYSIHDLLDVSPQYIPYYAGTFEGTEDTNVEWPHRHTFYSLVWFTEGTGFYVIDFQEYEIKPGRLFLVHPKQVHNWDYSENSEGYVLVVDTLLASELNIGHSFPFVDLDNTNSQLLESVFKNIVVAYTDKQDVKLDIQYLYKLIERYAKDKTPVQSDGNSVFEQFKRSILNDFTKKQSVEEYASSLFVSSDELNRFSKKTTGVSAKQYILDLKLTEAKRLLIYSVLNINEISYHIGFEDPSYFTRIFKKKANISPTDFLKKYRKQV